MAQTIEAFVGNALDEAKISPLHRRVVGLIAAGYFFDVIDFTVFGALVPFLLQSKFATGAEVAAIGSATIFGMFFGTAGQGEFSDRFGRRFIYQFNLLLFGIFTILGAFAPERYVADRLSLYRRARPRRRAAAGLRLCRRIFAQAHPRAHPRHRPFHRRRLRVADRHGVGALVRQLRHHARVCLARRLAAHRHRCADRLGVPFHIAGIAALSGDPRQRPGGAQGSRTSRHQGADRAAVVRRRQQHQERPDRHRLPHVPGPRRRRHDLLHGVLRRRDRARRLAAEHDERQGLHRSPSRCNIPW